MREFAHPYRDLPNTVRSDLLITTVRVEESPGHDLVHVWNRGGKSGVLTVNKGDGERVARRLIAAPFGEQPDPDVRHGGKHHGDPWCDPAAR